jgi:outer membrane protein assembly factor BamB
MAVRQLECRLTPSANVTTFHYDNASDGVNAAETTLTPSNVTSAGFGQLFTTPVDGNVYGQALYMSGVSITTGAGQGTHNVVFVGTEHDSLYAIDANNGSVLWKDSFLSGTYLPSGAVVTPIPSGDVAGSTIGPEIGITGTPVSI